MNFNYDSENDILVYKIEGKVDKEHIMNYYKHLAANNSYPRDLKTCINATECEFGFEIKDLRDIFNELEIAFQKYTSIREAILVAQPYETMIATLFAQGFKNPDYVFKVFSTRSAAQKWLKYP